MNDLPDSPERDDPQQTATDREILCAVCEPELTSTVRRWRSTAATGWALASLMTASMLVCWAWPSVVPGFGPNSDSLEATWADFDFRYPDSREASWDAWSDGDDAPKIVGEVQWSERKQVGVLRFEGLASLAAPAASSTQNDHSPEPAGDHAVKDAGHPDMPDIPDMVYQLWIVDRRSDGMAERVLISGGTFEVPPSKTDHSSDQASHEPEIVIVPFEPALEVHSVREFVLTIEPRGGVWVSDLSRPVARAVFEVE